MDIASSLPRFHFDILRRLAPTAEKENEIPCKQSCIKVTLHGTTCNNDFSRKIVARKIVHRVTWYRDDFLCNSLLTTRCEFLKPSQKLATQDDEYSESWLV